MASFGMQSPAEQFRTESSPIFGRQGNWDVDMRRVGDSRTACGRHASLPAEFGSQFELYDSTQEQSRASCFEKNLQLEMRLMERYIEQLIKYIESMLQSCMTSQNGDLTGSGAGGTKSGTDGGIKSGTDAGTTSGSDGGTKSGMDGGTKSGSDGGMKSGTDGGTKSGSDGGTKSGSDGGTKSGSGTSGSQSGNGSSPEMYYADTPVKRGKTIYRNDFNGARGEHPDSNVFDTQHISPDGLTRQRGKSIDEDAIISDSNTVMDGNGHLQLFADKQRTYDPVAKEFVDYTKGSFNTGKDKADNEHGLTFNLKDYPNGIVIETRAMHPQNPGTKFDALWIMTKDWAADPAKGQKMKDTIEYDAAEGGGAGITVHYPVKDSSGKSVDHYGGGAHPDLEDGKYHTYTVAISHNGDVVEYIDGKQAFAQRDVFPTNQDLHLKASLEVSPKWTGKRYTGNGGMNSDGAGYIDYLDVSEMKP
jgi:hypothetical protein